MPRMNATPADALALVDFWRDAGPQKWFAKDADFDRAFSERFEALHLQAAAGRLDDWAGTAEGALALVLLLDQLPRNAWRATAHMFATDPLARLHADQAIARGFDQAVPAPLRPFFYLPFMHSEALEDQRRSVALNAGESPDTSRYAQLHLDIIERFGRFPHRNRALARRTTEEEQRFLDEGGFAG